MAGSQLLLLKASLKNAGLTGQTNKKEKGKKKTPNESRKADKQAIILDIRAKFNPFEIKNNRNKRDINGTKAPVGKPGISKQIGEDQRLAAYKERKLQHNKAGGIVDRRFGENNPDLNPEQKMLERFTRERQLLSKKSLFNLEDDEDDEEEIEFIPSNKLPMSDDESETEEPQQETRKKTKAEVMKEVIAKSKLYKHERQKMQLMNENLVDELDLEFGDVMQELLGIPKPKAVIVPKSQQDIEYDSRIKELQFDRRSVPLDRTKTDEELKEEHDSKMKSLEMARLNRMNGVVESQGADDLDDEFWNGSGDELEGFTVTNESAESAESAGESDNETGLPERAPRPKAISCPETHEEFVDILGGYKFNETPNVVKKILDTYQPRLGLGNKEKLARFTSILFEHILYLTEQDRETEFVVIIEKLIKQLRDLADQYNELLYDYCKEQIIDIQDLINESNQVSIRELVFFTIIGEFYSTSDLYHLIVTPVMILICEILENSAYDFESVCQNVYLMELLLKYQRISKRYIPELVNSLFKSLTALSPESKSSFKFSKKDHLTDTVELSLSGMADLTPTIEVKSTLFARLISIVDRISSLYLSEPGFVEMMMPFQNLLKSLVKYFATNAELVALLGKINNLLRNNVHKPLKLQSHKPIALQTSVPKYEENFNPFKKSYDFDVQRQEINKLKLQLKKERKFTLKQIRQDTRFEAREQIKEVTKRQRDYHDKMSRIINSINTEEGHEKNEYERERKKRKFNK